MKLYCKKAFHLFKVGEALPDVPDHVGTKLVEQGLAQATKPRSNAKSTAKK